MLWYCRFTWHHGTTAEQVRQRVLEQHKAGENLPNKLHGWYNLAGGGAGFLLFESDDPQELTKFLEPYMDLMSWDVHAVYELSYDRAVESFQQKTPAMSSKSGGSGGSGGWSNGH